MKRIDKLSGFSALVCVLAVMLTACSSTPASPGTEKAPEITVSASSTVRLVPDKATVSFGVTTQEKTAELAQTKNTEAVDHVIEVLIGRGVEEKSIRTVNYYMYPQYDWSETGEQRIMK